MIGQIYRLTLRQMVFRKSTLALAALAMLPVLIGVIFTLSDSGENAERWLARSLYRDLIIAVVLPLTALLIGTSALGDEFEDGTAVYLLAKPIPRWQILVPKVAASWTLTSILLVASTVITGIIVTSGSSLIPGFAIAIIVGALAYCCVFTYLSIAMTRALIAGLVYVFVWEGVITMLFTGARYFSVRYFTAGLGGYLSDASAFVFNTTVGGTTAIIMFAIVIAGALVLANRRLERYEVRDSS